MRLMPHIYRACWNLVLLYPIPSSCSDGRLAASNTDSILVTGDLLIGAVMPLHIDKLFLQLTFQEKPPADVCTMFRFEHYQQFQALRFAVDEINRSPDLLPNTTLGFYVYDSCAVLPREIEGTLWMLTGDNRAVANYRCHERPPLAAVIGHSTSTFSILMAHLLGLYRYPQVPLSICSKSCPNGFRKAARRGEPICCFQCIPCGQGEISNQTDSIDCSKCPWDMWHNTQRDQCLPKAIDYLSYDEPLGMALASTSVSSSIIPLSIFSLFIHYKNTPIVRANNYILSCILLMSLSLCFLCSLAFIGFPHPENCLLRQATFGMVFTICVSCILAKTIMVVFAFMATKPGSRLKKWTSPRVSYMIINICSMVQFILCITWLSFSPPFPQYNIQTQPEVIIVECNEGSAIAFWSMLGYLGLLATISFIVAFMARRLPDSFNEAKFITFSMLAFLSVWLSYIPASLSARGKYTVAMEIFAIQSSSWALVLCMFFPKCFVIVFRPGMNSKEHLMGRSKAPNQ
ncbi:vomeronasal type-2 receptor 26-like [Pelodytes ibericus]